MNYIFTNALIFPMDAVGPSEFNSLLVSDGKIRLLGSLRDCIAEGVVVDEVIDLGGKALLPAFTDTHTHFTEFALQQYQLDLSNCITIDEIKTRLRKYREQYPILPDWILGGGWDKNRLDSPESLNSTLLDEVFPYVPVALFSKDYHSRLCNSMALRIAVINNSSQDPSGGKLQKDKDGKLTGILTETAAELIDQYIVPPSDEQIVTALHQAVKVLHSFGLTKVHCMENNSRAKLLESFARDSHSIRVCRHFPLDELDYVIEQGLTSYKCDAWFRLGGVKIFADGSLGSQTAAVYHEYQGSEGNSGILRHDKQDLYRIASKAASHGLSCTVHAIGNRAVNAVVNTFLKLKDNFPDRGLLSRIEHVQSIAPEDIMRLKSSDAYCSMQPVHLSNDIDMINEYWAAISDQAYCFKSILEHGIPCGFGSDAPIETINPFHGIYSAITRKKGLDPREQSWYPEQLISSIEALYAYTLGAAKGSKSQEFTGSLSPGKVADIIVLEDFTKLPDEYWLDARSLLTMVDGRIVHRTDV